MEERLCTGEGRMGEAFATDLERDKALQAQSVVQSLCSLCAMLSSLDSVSQALEGLGTGATHL